MKLSLRLLGVILLFFCPYICLPEIGLSTTYPSQSISPSFKKELKKEIFLLDFKNTPKIPKNFRSTWRDISRIPSPISTIGLKSLRIAGSHEFSQLELDSVLKENPEINTVIDLRQETHFFVNGNAVTLFSRRDRGNKRFTDAQILHNEKTLLEKIRQEPSLTLQDISYKDPKNTKKLKTYPLTFDHPLIMSEEDLVKDKGLSYLRVFVTDDESPIPAEVDRFITFVRALPPEAGLYFHCRDGQGRTTAFMALYDMMKNAKTVSFKDIVTRQYHLGGQNLLHIVKTGYKRPLQEQRLAFLRQFYEYAKNNTDDFSTPWTTYLQKNASL